jgi:Tol biopolymer transport system component
MFGGKHPMGACTWDWGPTPGLADQIIYTENSGEQSSIFRIKEGGTHPGTILTSYSDIQYQLLYDLHWLPDGSGLLYSTVTLMRDAGNIFRYDFQTKKTTQVTHLENEFAHNFSISPDGMWLVYERSKSHEDDTGMDVWIQKLDGTGSRLLVKNGRNPSWGKY